jgi:thiol-disulfide isomerase/thioredoxin
MGGLLAGQIIDGLNRRPPPTFIQVSSAAEGGGPNRVIMDVEANSDGYFTIERLEPGKSYQLIARARYGDRILAGATVATPPNPTVLIQISEDLARPSTPPLPGPPAIPGGARPTPSPATTPAAPLVGGTDPLWGPPRGAADAKREVAPPADLKPPVKGNDANPSQAAPAAPAAGSVRPESIAEKGLAQADPPVSIPSPAPTLPSALPPAPPATAVAPAPQAASSERSLPVPSCVLIGDRLHNFALYDLYGKPWEYSQHRGRLVLLDFWATNCLPCLHAIPHLKSLQDSYGQWGLEVVGIAYEQGDFWSQAQKVQQVRGRLGINYRLLLGSDREREPCPVRKQFQVRAFPTVFLLENDQIIKSWEGLEGHWQDLELLIKQRLGVK